MAHKQQRTRYEFSDTVKASMILFLDQFPERMETITQIKESIRVPGAIVLDTYEALILAGLIREYWPISADKLTTPLESINQYEAGEYAKKHRALMERLR